MSSCARLVLVHSQGGRERQESGTHIRQDHFFMSVDSRRAATSTPSFANALIRALESSSSNCIFAAEPPGPAKPKTTRTFFRLFSAPGRAATKATRSRLRTVPLGRLTRLFFMLRIVRLAIYSAIEKFIRSDDRVIHMLDVAGNGIETHERSPTFSGKLVLWIAAQERRACLLPRFSGAYCRG